MRLVRTVFSVFGIQLRRRRCRLARARRQMLAGSACGTTIKTKEPYNCRHPPAPSVLSCPSKLNAKMDCLFIGRACARTSRRRLSLVGFVNASEFGWNPASRARRQITYLGYGDAGRGGHDSIHLTAGRPPIVKQVGGFPSAGRVVVVPLLDTRLKISRRAASTSWTDGFSSSSSSSNSISHAFEAKDASSTSTMSKPSLVGQAASIIDSARSF